ncbi:MAG: glycosyltransferase family 2 protein [Deltaproteobacteria bacterium]|nr:glycosyltransferase family 2 protein [Deltaproteobacteria bacterium]
MLDGVRVAVVVPAFNVAPRIAAVIQTLPSWVDRVWVVDDGSTDDTFSTANSLTDHRTVVLKHPHNRGVGAAIATGYRAAMQDHTDVIVVMAGDGQMDPADLLPLVHTITQRGAHYAKGNRLAHPDVWRVMPPVRLAGNLVLSALTRAATGLWHITDSQCGYTAISNEALKTVALDALWPRYGYPNDLLAALARDQREVRDVTVRPVYDGAPSGVRWRDALVTIPRILLAATLRRAEQRPRMRR